MTAQEFCYWLQGWFELNKTIDHREGATPETMKMIEEHLQLVFHKVTNTPVQEEKIEFPAPMPVIPSNPVWPNMNDFLSRPTLIC